MPIFLMFYSASEVSQNLCDIKITYSCKDIGCVCRITTMHPRGQIAQLYICIMITWAI
jgi:hypothetical protein